MILTKYSFLFLILISSYTGFSQVKNLDDTSLNNKKQWFVSIAGGLQISGIKSEDFVKSNVTPSFFFGAGVWFTPEIGLQMGCKGFSFNYIGDDSRHYYNYFYGEVLLNVTEIIGGSVKNRKWSVVVHPGTGYFYNRYYRRQNIFATIGLINGFSFNNHFDIYADFSAVMGWDIYQGDNDILPSWLIGVNYRL